MAETLDANGGNPLENALCNGTRRRRIGAAQQHDEFFSAKATDDVGLTQLRVNGSNDRPQASISRLMAERIIDELEMVEIDEKDGYRQPTRSRPQARGFEPLDLRTAIQHARERIGLCASFCVRQSRPLSAQAIGDPQGNQHRRSHH